MPAAVHEDHCVIGRCHVQRARIRMSPNQIVIVSASEDRQSRRRHGGFRCDLCQQGLTRRHAALWRQIKQAEGAHLVKDRARMHVNVDESGGDGLLPGIDEVGARADERAGACIIADIDDATVIDRHGAGGWPRRIHRPDRCVDDDEVCWLSKRCDWPGDKHQRQDNARQPKHCRLRPFRPG